MSDRLAGQVQRDTFIVASQVRYFRELRGLSQQDLADACGMFQTAVSRLELTPDHKWTSGTLLRIAAALDLKVDIRLETTG